MKGLYTQGIAVLFDRVPSLDEIEAALPPASVVSRRDAGEGVGWEMGGAEVICAMRPQVNGHITIDVVPRPWPDHMGDPQSEMMLFGAWSMGHFGPFTFPGNLERAAQHVWLEEPAPLQNAASEHQAFARIRCTYVLGAGPDTKVMPQDYEPLAELQAVNALALEMGSVPGALCVFNPNGEALRSFDFVRQALERERNAGPMALEVWSNLRFFNIAEAPGWALMDTVGMRQADTGSTDCTDHEACFPASRYDAGEVDNFLRNMALYLLEKGPVIRDGDTSDGPGGVRWQARAFENGLMAAPPRPTLRWFPLDDTQAPPEMLAAEPG